MQRRPSQDEWLLELVKGVAQRSDCRERSAGAIIANALGDVLSVGFLRSPTGNCVDSIRCATCTAEHAPIHALGQVDRRRCSGGTIYLTDRPCATCIAAISHAGIHHIRWPDGGTHTSAYWFLAQHVRDDWNSVNLNG